ncbi:MAG: peptidoglycan-binding protein [Acidobacteria bacterium]|nr:peptidoglycan-binding protein [Acidobacteriota bacterium]
MKSHSRPKSQGVTIGKQGATVRRGFFASGGWPLASTALLACATILQPGAVAQTTSKPTNQVSKTRNSPAKKPSSARSASPATSRRSTATQKKRVSKRPSKRPKAAAPAARQLRPTPARYAEIQTALAKAGYYEGPANGAWDQSSIQALQRFQADQGLEPTGKIDSWSLIKLDLGPKYDDQASLTSNK